MKTTYQYDQALHSWEARKKEAENVIAGFDQDTLKILLGKRYEEIVEMKNQKLSVTNRLPPLRELSNSAHPLPLMQPHNMHSAMQYPREYGAPPHFNAISYIEHGYPSQAYPAASHQPRLPPPPTLLQPIDANVARYKQVPLDISHTGPAKRKDAPELNSDKNDAKRLRL